MAIGIGSSIEAVRSASYVGQGPENDATRKVFANAQRGATSVANGLQISICGLKEWLIEENCHFPSTNAMRILLTEMTDYQEKLAIKNNLLVSIHTRSGVPGTNCACHGPFF